jgi:hypothetical protein
MDRQSRDMEWVASVLAVLAVAVYVGVLCYTGPC